MELLKTYNWPGNVRELENAIERSVVLSKSRTLGKEDFSFLQAPSVPPLEPRALREMEKEYIEFVLSDCNWNVTKAAKILDVNRVSLHKMIKRYDLKRP
jgi:two-component system response regulator HydG